MNPLIEILILNWNGGKMLKECIASVKKIDYSNYKIRIIDNASSDNSIEMVKNTFSNINYTQLDENYGFSKGYNKYFNQIDSKELEYILILNNDTIVDANILNSFIEATKKFGKNNIYGPKIFYRNRPNLIWYAGAKVNLKYGKISHIGIRKKDSQKYSLSAQTDYVTGCCLFTSIKNIKDLNGFDERFQMYGEDVDFCIRARENNILCYYWPNAILYHHVSFSIGGNYSIKKIYRKLIGLIKLIIKHR